VSGPPLGVLPGQTWPAVAARLPSPWSVFLYTDGLIEGRRRGGGDERLGVEGLLARLAAAGLGAPDDAAGLEATLAWVESEHGGPLADDVAVMLVAGAAG
jgi:hypothetical protein